MPASDPSRNDIRDLVARYNAYGDRGRFDELLALFVEDASMTLDDRSTYNGLAEIRTIFETASDGGGAGPSRISHFTSTHIIDYTDDSHATGTCYYQVITDKGLDHWGRYFDEYVLDGDAWKFQKRRVTLDALVEGGWAHSQRPERSGL